MIPYDERCVMVGCLNKIEDKEYAICPKCREQMFVKTVRKSYVKGIFLPRNTSISS